mmetsp:Transcript_150960/g.263807  ORF Transcript_150960/g.263807 Transcript_150960/m.263807 type:complete len:232 (+) Transcript_150960:69-764(+)
MTSSRRSTAANAYTLAKSTYETKSSDVRPVAYKTRSPHGGSSDTPTNHLAPHNFLKRGAGKAKVVASSGASPSTTCGPQLCDLSNKPQIQDIYELREKHFHLHNNFNVGIPDYKFIPKPRKRGKVKEYVNRKSLPIQRESDTPFPTNEVPLRADGTPYPMPKRLEQVYAELQHRVRLKESHGIPVADVSDFMEWEERLHAEATATALQHAKKAEAAEARSPATSTEREGEA